ncbi:hypothetical protein [Bradyrhizobium daqingense]|nr:hypothetical protein [Bradyrhizobium daqingense]
MLLLAALWMQTSLARHWIIVTLAVVFGFAGLANAVAIAVAGC